MAETANLPASIEKPALALIIKLWKRNPREHHPIRSLEPKSRNKTGAGSHFQNFVNKGSPFWGLNVIGRSLLKFGKRMDGTSERKSVKLDGPKNRVFMGH